MESLPFHRAYQLHSMSWSLSTGVILKKTPWSIDTAELCSTRNTLRCYHGRSRPWWAWLGRWSGGSWTNPSFSRAGYNFFPFHGSWRSTLIWITNEVMYGTFTLIKNAFIKKWKKKLSIYLCLGLGSWVFLTFKKTFLRVRPFP